jgi:NAD(P)H-dependent FMN reductase
LEIGDLPLYNQDDDANQSESVKRLKAGITAAKGLLFVTPEYNRSIPGVLKNAIDHASRPYGQSAWAGKPAGVLGVSVGANGTARRNSICEICWPIWTFQPWVSQKRSFKHPPGCLRKTVN